MRHISAAPWAIELLIFGCQLCRSAITWVWGAEISCDTLAALSIGAVMCVSVPRGYAIRGVATQCIVTPHFLNISTQSTTRAASCQFHRAYDHGGRVRWGTYRN
jgi:hypothetical protein